MVSSMKNLKEFKELIKNYRSITMEELIQEKLNLPNRYSAEDLEDEEDYPALIISNLTGYGSTGTCSLCFVKDHYNFDFPCKDCVWFDSEFTMNPCINHNTFLNIDEAKSLEDLFKAVKARADYMEEWLLKKGIKLNDEEG